MLTDNERQQLKERLFAEKCSCVIRSGGETRLFHERGVKDLFRLLREEPQFLHGAFVADKVVGKGAAALMILGGVEEVFAGVISEPAIELFQRAQVRVTYTQLVPHIINRAKTDLCPLEKRCSEAATAAACLPLIEEFVASLPK